MLWTPLALTGLEYELLALGGNATLTDSVIACPLSDGDDSEFALRIFPETTPRTIRITTQAFSGAADSSIFWALDGNLIQTQPNLTAAPAAAFTPSPLTAEGGNEIAFAAGSSELQYSYSFLVEVLMDDQRVNCDCDDENNNQTLLQLRTRLLRRIGASGMTAVPGPGMAELADDFLQSSQEMLYREYDVLRTIRFFTWNLEQGVRFYDLAANADECTRKWDPRKVVWVGISGADEWWQPLRCGIQPEFYSWNDVQGWPQLYEVRQCIEIWPAPDAGPWKLRVKGDFGLEPFAADGDKTTIDSEAVFLHALARFKAHLQQPDARNYEADCMRYIGNLTAGAHQTRRYVPGAVVEPNAIPPVWLPLNGGPP